MQMFTSTGEDFINDGLNLRPLQYLKFLKDPCFSISYKTLQDKTLFNLEIDFLNPGHCNNGLVA